MCCIQESLVKLLKQSDLSETQGNPEISMKNAQKLLEILFNVSFFIYKRNLMPALCVTPLLYLLSHYV